MVYSGHATAFNPPRRRLFTSPLRVFYKTAEGSLPNTAEGSLSNTAEGSLSNTAEGSWHRHVGALQPAVYSEDLAGHVGSRRRGQV